MGWHSMTNLKASSWVLKSSTFDHLTPAAATEAVPLPVADVAPRPPARAREEAGAEPSRMLVGPRPALLPSMSEMPAVVQGRASQDDSCAVNPTASRRRSFNFLRFFRSRINCCCRRTAPFTKSHRPLKSVSPPAAKTSSTCATKSQCSPRLLYQCSSSPRDNEAFSTRPATLLRYIVAQSPWPTSSPLPYSTPPSAATSSPSSPSAASSSPCDMSARGPPSLAC
mmetsp:Transcript_137537/g.357389  ORF Transcript_137537/g.357389 Transcript_137537/m.357389 type:complete len:225 (+) Transcript_137537:777-1451(+)